jgi:pimeloyl-ACP methyl ester carboxylesterase
MRDNSVERLFALFTSPERATAMAGDLAEERSQHGTTWYWLHVLTVTLALWRNASTEAPLRVLALMTLGLVLLTAPVLAGTAAIFILPGLYGSPINLVPLSLFWWGGALWVGASLATMAQQRGMAACAMLAVAGAGLLLALGAASEPTDFLSPRGYPNFTAALGATVALLAGGSLARRRTIAVVVPFFIAVAFGATAVVFAAPAGSWRAMGSPRAGETEWRDPSPHAVKMVSVDRDVELEVLDWGGSGPALVLLAGLGGTAHHYDDLAPQLTGRYRVVALTRRGTRGSSAATSGYEVARLAEDVLRVIDAVGVNNPVVIGASFAGEEMHVLGARHSAKIRGLVYVDAAFDRGDSADSEAYNAVAKTLPASPGPEPADRASFTAFRRFLEKKNGVAAPEAFLRTRYLTNPDGSVGEQWIPEKSVREEMVRAMRAAFDPYTPERIRVPAVAIYALPKSPADLLRRGSSDRGRFSDSFIASAEADPATRERVEKLFLLTRNRVRKHEQWFEAFAAGGRVVELSGPHDLIVSNSREVLEQIQTFVASLPQGQ